MIISDEKAANIRTFRLRSSPTALLTICCTNVFGLTKSDRDFVLGILETLERYEANKPTISPVEQD